MRDEPGLTPADLARLLDLELGDAPLRRRKAARPPGQAPELSEDAQRELDAWMERVQKHLGCDDSGE